MWTLPSLALISAVFVLAGFMKGVVGFGLPMIVVAVLTAIYGLPEAMALMLVPAFLSNLWQAAVGGRFRELSKRLWSLLASAALFTWFASGLLAGADARILTGGLGLFLLLYAATSLATPQVPPPGKHETWLSPIVGAATGVLTGLTGVYVLPSGLYVQTLGLGRDGLIQAMGIVFSVATIALTLSLAGRSMLPADLLLLSGAATAPTLVGLVAGQHFRRQLPEKKFRNAFFACLALLSLYLIWRAVA